MERRTLWAILLMMAIAIAPAFFFRKSAKPAVTRAERSPVAVDSAKRDSGQRTSATAPAAAPADTSRAAAPSPPAADTTTPPALVTVSSCLATWTVSSRGARIVSARLNRYRSLAPGESHKPVELIRGRSDILPDPFELLAILHEPIRASETKPRVNRVQIFPDLLKSVTH